MQKTHSDIGFRCIKPSDVSEVKDAKALHKTSLSDRSTIITAMITKTQVVKSVKRQWRLKQDTIVRL
ncbi:hypothetical protein CN454_32930 [Bacillus cereus]|nr:hypothetical protein CN454_32930 [Bacillus cereus]